LAGRGGELLGTDRALAQRVGRPDRQMREPRLAHASRLIPHAEQAPCSATEIVAQLVGAGRQAVRFGLGVDAPDLARVAARPWLHPLNRGATASRLAPPVPPISRRLPPAAGLPPPEPNPADVITLPAPPERVNRSFGCFRV